MPAPRVEASVATVALVAAGVLAVLVALAYWLTLT